jgi:hypothetical protein
VLPCQVLLKPSVKEKKMHLLFQNDKTSTVAMPIQPPYFAMYSDQGNSIVDFLVKDDWNLEITVLLRRSYVRRGYVGRGYVGITNPVMKDILKGDKK